MKTMKLALIAILASLTFAGLSFSSSVYADDHDTATQEDGSHDEHGDASEEGEEDCGEDCGDEESEEDSE